MSKPRQILQSELLIIPDPQVRSEVVLISRDPKSSGTGIYFSSDGGKTFRAMIPAPKASDRAGSVLTLNSKLSAEWKFLEAKSGTTSSVSNARTFIPFQVIGTLQQDTIFGYFKVPAGKSAILYEIQLSVQDVADQNISIDICNGSGAAQGRVATLTSGGQRSTYVLQNPLKMSSRSVWMMKVTGCGTSSAPGQNLTALAGIEYQA